MFHHGHVVTLATMITGIVMSGKAQLSQMSAEIPTEAKDKNIYGWNVDFIIAQQHPVQDGFDEINTAVTDWFILEVATGEVHGPLTEAAYIRRRQTLGVPDDLNFTHTVEP